MADEVKNPLAFMIDDCLYPSSEEELVARLKFARECENISDDDNSSDMEDTGTSRRELDGTDETMKIHGSESTAIAKNLGFGGEGKLEETRVKEPELKKHKVTPLVDCSGKKANEVDDDDDDVVILGEGNTEVIDLEEETVKKRVLPPSMYGIPWGVASDYDIGGGLKAKRLGGNKDEVTANNGDGESGLRKVRVEGKSDCKLKEGGGNGEEDGTNKCILAGLKLLRNDKRSGDSYGGNIDVYETAKRLGMKFPGSRFLTKAEEDE